MDDRFRALKATYGVLQATEDYEREKGKRKELERKLEQKDQMYKQAEENYNALEIQFQKLSYTHKSQLVKDLQEANEQIKTLQSEKKIFLAAKQRMHDTSVETIKNCKKQLEQMDQLKTELDKERKRANMFQSFVEQYDSTVPSLQESFQLLKDENDDLKKRVAAPRASPVVSGSSATPYYGSEKYQVSKEDYEKLVKQNEDNKLKIKDVIEKNRKYYETHSHLMAEKKELIAANASQLSKIETLQVDVRKQKALENEIKSLKASLKQIAGERDNLRKQLNFQKSFNSSRKRLGVNLKHIRRTVLPEMKSEVEQCKRLVNDVMVVEMKEFLFRAEHLSKVAGESASLEGVNFSRLKETKAQLEKQLGSCREDSASFKRQSEEYCKELEKENYRKESEGRLLRTENEELRRLLEETNHKRCTSSAGDSSTSSLLGMLSPESSRDSLPWCQKCDVLERNLKNALRAAKSLEKEKDGALEKVKEVESEKLSIAQERDNYSNRQFRLEIEVAELQEMNKQLELENHKWRNEKNQ